MNKIKNKTLHSAQHIMGAFSPSCPCRCSSIGFHGTLGCVLLINESCAGSPGRNRYRVHANSHVLTKVQVVLMPQRHAKRRGRHVVGTALGNPTDAGGRAMYKKMGPTQSETVHTTRAVVRNEKGSLLL